MAVMRRDVGNRIEQSKNLGRFRNRGRTFKNSLDPLDKIDVYRFKLTSSKRVNISVSDLSKNSNIDVVVLSEKRKRNRDSKKASALPLRNSDRKANRKKISRIGISRQGKGQNESIEFDRLKRGTYFIRLLHKRGRTSYQLKVDANRPLPASQPIQPLTVNRSFNIKFDYRFDTRGYFTPERRAVLNKAANLWTNYILDEFPNVPAGVPFDILNPETGARQTIALDTEIDDLVIFVGSQNPPFGIPDNSVARGGIAGLAAETGTVFQKRLIASNFEPWAGHISYRPSAFLRSDGSFWEEAFLSTTLHEIGHVLGIGTAKVFNDIGSGALFDGPNTLAVTGGTPVPLDADLDHLRSDVRFENQLPVMRSGGIRNLTRLDLALLADIGYVVDGFQAQGTSLPLTTQGNDVVQGTVVADVINGFAGNDQLRGGAGSDSLSGGTGNDQLFGGEGNDIFVFDTSSGGIDQINDFVVADDRIQVSAEFGYVDGDDILSRAVVRERPSTSGRSFTDLSISTNNSVRVFHDFPLSALNFVVV